jgi:DNA-binding NarL/FixJ family response regulator
VLHRHAAPIRVMIVDHEVVVRRGFRAIVDHAPGMVTVAEFATGRDAVTMVGKVDPDIVLLEINVERGEGVQDVIAGLRRNDDSGVGRRACRVIVLTSCEDDEALYFALRAQASGFLLKDVTEDDLVNAVEVVAGGAAVICPKMVRKLIDRFEIFPPRDRLCHANALGTLSNRELDVLSSLVRGKSNQLIARDLHVASTTVKTHVSNLLAKLGVSSRIEAALLAQEAGLCPPADKPK